MKRNMIRKVVVAAAVCAGVFVAPTGAGEQGTYTLVTQAPPADAGADRTKALEKLLNDYAGENAALKLRVKELEAQVQALQQNRRVTVVPGPLKMPSTDKVPPDWKPFEFNGVTYYIVPCDQKAQSGTYNLKVTPGVEWRPVPAERGSGTLRLNPQPRVEERPAK